MIIVTPTGTPNIAHLRNEASGRYALIRHEVGEGDWHYSIYDAAGNLLMSGASFSAAASLRQARLWLER